jgi:hypothetical protein
MDNTHAAAEGNNEHGFSTKAVWRTFWILLVITVVELILRSFTMKQARQQAYPEWRFFISDAGKGIFIVAEFMHLGHETATRAMTRPPGLFVHLVSRRVCLGRQFLPICVCVMTNTTMSRAGKSSKQKEGGREEARKE